MIKKIFPTIKQISKINTVQLRYVNSQKVLAVLYEGRDSSKEKRLLSCRENELGLRKFIESKGHKYVVISDKDKLFEKELQDTNILITTPFFPAYVTKERIRMAKNLKLSITAGIGSDHIDLEAAKEANITVVEVTGSNVVSVAEHVVMQILALVRNYIPAYKQAINGEWDVAKVAERAFDLEGKVVGTVGLGRIGQRVMQRLKGFDCKELLYFDIARATDEVERELSLRYVPSVEELVKQCDIVTINCPLHSGTEGLFNKKILYKMKKGAFLVNTARGKIVERDALVEALKSGHLGGYAGDVWYPQPAPKDHPYGKISKNLYFLDGELCHVMQ